MKPTDLDKAEAIFRSNSDEEYEINLKKVMKEKRRMHMKDEAIKLSDAKVVAGRLIPVYNKGHKGPAKLAYKAVWVEDADGKNERCLLFTDNELKIAEERAGKNKEDLPRKGFLTALFD